MHVLTFCFSYGKLNRVSPPLLWHFFCKDFCAFQQANNEMDFSFVQTNIASRVEMFLGSEIFLHESVWEHNRWMSVFRETIATDHEARQASRHVGWISILLTKHICFIADLNTRFFSCIHFFFMNQFLLFVLVGRRMCWALRNATIWSVSHKSTSGSYIFFKLDNSFPINCTSF